jgi:GMP synthase (glutamine-hydrolysing)
MAISTDKPKKTCVVIQHVSFEGLGSFAHVLNPQNWDVTWLLAPVDALTSAKDADLCIILGGPIGVYETQAYPFLIDELNLASYRIDRELPTLGICLGAQILAQAGGGKVYPGTQGKELGWSKLIFEHSSPNPSNKFSSTDSSNTSNSLAESISYPHFLAPLAQADTPVLHWHGDTFNLPAHGRNWASTTQYQNQIFTIGKSMLGFQCHPEVRAQDLELWYVGHTLEISQTPGVSVETLRADSQIYSPKIEQPAQMMIRDWLKAQNWK